jgi:hypothetical protein
MTRHDYDIANGSGSAVRADINQALTAIRTSNSGSGTSGLTMFPYLTYCDTTDDGMRQIASDGSTVRGVRLFQPQVVTSLNDVNNAPLLTISATASAVNAVTLTNAATGNSPSLAASGTDTNINLTLSPKGSASVLLGTGTVTNPSFAFTGDTNTGIYRRATDMVGIVEGGIGYPVGYRNTPLSGQEITTAYTLTTADCGKLVTIGTSGSVVVPSDFNAGDIVYLFNNTSGTVNVTKGSITTLYQSGSNTAQTTITMASRTMAAIQFISNTVAVFFSGAASSSSTAFNLDYLIIGGGGGGHVGGGGAGGYINSLTGESYGGGGSRPFSISITPSTTQYIVTVGAGGAAISSGAASVFHTIAALGGGNGVGNGVGVAGGSGGGGYGASGGGNGVPNMGYAGGAGGSQSGGGGGGAGAIGSSGGSGVGGAGGAGLSSSITGTSVTRAGGGGGGGSNSSGAGGAGGGGAGASSNSTAGTANTGGGGGGIYTSGSAAGGSGVVILRYVTADYSGTRTTTGSPSVTTSGIYTILTFNSSGSVTFGV